MSFLLRIKHWQIFLMTGGLFIIASILTVILQVMTQIDHSKDAKYFLSMIAPIMNGVLIWNLFFLFTWLWLVVRELHKKLPQEVKININAFKLYFTAPIVYGLVVFFLIKNTNIFIDQMMIFVPFNILAGISIILCFRYTSKLLNSVLLQHEAKAKDYFEDFFMIWFFIPIGVWFIQPKINNIISTEKLD